MITICSYCKEECKPEIESGDFTANGPRFDIIGNCGDMEISDCCSEPIVEVDDDLYWFFTKIMEGAKERGFDHLISNDPRAYRQSFAENIEVAEVLDILSLEQ